MKKAPYFKGGGKIKGEPDKPVKSTIDRTKYATILGKPISGDGTNFVSDDPNSFTPELLKANGYNYVSGTMGAKDIVYEKNGNMHLYNEQPNSKENKYGLINVGNPNSPAIAPSIKAPVINANLSKPAIDPNRKPIDFSNPNMTYDPNTGAYTNPVTGKAIEPIVKQYKGGGPVKGYADDGLVLPNPDSGTTNDYVANRAKAQNNQSDINAENKAKRNSNIKKGANVAGTALGAYGTGYYATNPGETQGDQSRSAVLGAVSAVGPVGGAVSGLAAIGDKIGKPIKDRSERTDENGNLISPGMAKRNAIIGGLLSPSKAWSTRKSMNEAGYSGNKLFGFGKEYTKYLEDQPKKDIEAKKLEDARLKAIENANRLEMAVNSRDNGDLSQTTFKDGGQIKGAGTGKSDSISANMKAGSFIVPAENADIAEEIREKVLRKAPSKKANLKQKGGEEIKVSNGEHAFTPEENAELKAKGIDLFDLAPNSEHDTDNFDGGGGVKTKAERDKLKAEEAAIRKANSDAYNKNKVSGIYKNRLSNQNNASKKLIESDNALKYLNKEYEDYVKRINSGDRLIGESDERIRANKKVMLDKIDKAKEYRNSANSEYRKAYGKDVSSGNADNSISEIKKSPNKTKFYTRSQDGFSESDVNSNSMQQIDEPVASKGKRGGKRTAVDNTAAFNASLAPSAIAEDDLSIRPPQDAARASQTAVDDGSDTGVLAGAPNGTPTPTVTVDANGKKKFDYSNILGNVINYGIPIAQTAIGLNQLKKAGKRPVDGLDADYVNSLGRLKTNVTDAERQAKYGYTEAEKAYLNNQNNNLTNAGRFAARNFSGGSGASMLNAERSVINDAFGRKLQMSVNDKNLQLQKQNMAFDRQQSLNNAIQDKQDRLRSYFSDDLNAFHQKTGSAAALVNAGLTNAMDSYRAEQRLKNFKENNQNT